MRWQEFPVLGEDDREVVEEFAVGLGRDAARVLAYLVRRAALDDPAGPAPRLAIRVGTGLGRDGTIAALRELEERDLVTATTLRQSSSGRPPKGWTAAGDREATAARIRRGHARALLERAATVGAAFGTDVTLGPSPPTGSREPEQEEQAPAQEPASDAAVTLALNWAPNGLHAPFFAAAAAGHYRDRGVPASFDPARGSRAALEKVAAGDADVGIAGAATFCRAVDRNGRQLVPLALVYRRAMAVLYTADAAFGGPLTDLEQLRGRRLATPRGSETGALARLLLAQAGLLEAVEVIETDGEERGALLSGPAEAATGVLTDPIRLEADGHEVSYLLVADHFPVPGPALVTRADVLEARRPAVEAFLAATMAGWTAAARDPAGAARAVADRGDADPDAAAARRQFEQAIERFAGGDAVRAHGWGWQTAETWRRLATALDQADALQAP